MKDFPFKNKDFVFIAFLLALSVLLACKDKTVEQPKKDCPKDFSIFFEKFGSDRSFQCTHIRYPLAFAYLSSDYDKIIDSVIPGKKLAFIDFSNDRNALSNQTDKFTTSLQKAGTKMIYRRKGYDNGILISYDFMHIDDCWTLVKVTDEST